MLRDRRIAILALQETHLDDERARSLNTIFERNMTILHSPDPDNATGGRGVAFAINKRILKESNPTIRCVVPGRAILLKLKWSDDRDLKILNVYAPNDGQTNAAFWRTLREKNLGRIDLMLGDFNVVEDRADRLPARDDPEAPRDALRSLCESHSLLDGWRMTRPIEQAFTYLQESTCAQSRLDRIYVRQRMAKDCSDWEISAPGIPTDHLLVTVAVENYKAPFIGRGRWAMPEHLLTDETMKKTMKLLATTLISSLTAGRVRTEEENPQTAYATFKRDLIAAARARAKEKVPKIQRKMDGLKKDLDRL
ncbi:DNase I-like protein, partial [Trametes versicolor FP-101664 SS1]|uniref:DNase I-like protein n=1 Tax=Trametes versicolor (strain FP-101664) TaxID=717944 RepID=UPI000462209C